MDSRDSAASGDVVGHRRPGARRRVAARRTGTARRLTAVEGPAQASAAVPAVVAALGVGARGGVLHQLAELDDAAVLAVLDKMVKQRRDSVEQFENGNREDLAAIERAEIEVLQGYLPEQLSADELTALVDEVITASGAEGMRDMGKVMGQIKAKAAGRADMGAVSATVKERLAAL